MDVICSYQDRGLLFERLTSGDVRISFPNCPAVWIVSLNTWAEITRTMKYDKTLCEGLQE